MTETGEDAFDIPDPERVLEPSVEDPATYDPGADEPIPRTEPDLGEDPAYDPGGQGRQPDVVESDEEYR